MRRLSVAVVLLALTFTAGLSPTSLARQEATPSHLPHDDRRGERRHCREVARGGRQPPQPGRAGRDPGPRRRPPRRRPLPGRADGGRGERDDGRLPGRLPRPALRLRSLDRAGRPGGGALHGDRHAGGAAWRHCRPPAARRPGRGSTSSASRAARSPRSGRRWTP